LPGAGLEFHRHADVRPARFCATKAGESGW
jgi:hypothetical protein